MNEKNLKHLWQSAPETTALRPEKLLSAIQQKSPNPLVRMTTPKVFALLAGIGWVMAIGPTLFYLSYYAYGSISPFLLFSAGAQVLITAIAVGVYGWQLYLIHTTDLSGPVVPAQKRLCSLKTSTLRVTRILFLQLPLWTTFYLHKGMFIDENFSLLFVQAVVTGGSVAVAIWLFFNIQYENRHQKWFQWIFQGREWEPIMEAMTLLETVEQFEKND